LPPFEKLPSPKVGTLSQNSFSSSELYLKSDQYTFFGASELAGLLSSLLPGLMNGPWIIGGAIFSGFLLGGNNK